METNQCVSNLYDIDEKTVVSTQACNRDLFSNKMHARNRHLVKLSGIKDGLHIRPADGVVIYVKLHCHLLAEYVNHP